MYNNPSTVVTFLFLMLSLVSFKAHAVYVEYYQIDHSASNRLQIDNTLEGDNNISAAEEAHINITGSQAEFGARVMVIINDQNNRSIGPLNATIEPNGRWYIANLDTSSLVDGDLQITAIETDTLGNVSDPVNKILHKDSLGPNGAFVNLNSLFGN
ncbi:MAG: hypothetical protein ACWA5U_10970 [bacterium]